MNAVKRIFWTNEMFINRNESHGGGCDGWRVYTVLDEQALDPSLRSKSCTRFGLQNKSTEVRVREMSCFGLMQTFCVEIVCVNSSPQFPLNPVLWYLNPTMLKSHIWMLKCNIRSFGRRENRMLSMKYFGRQKYIHTSVNVCAYCPLC